MYHSLSIHLLKDILVASKFWQLWIKLLKTSMCRFLCVYVFSSFGEIPKSTVAVLCGKNIFSFVRNLPTVFPFTFSPVLIERSCCSTSSPAFVFVSVIDFDHCNRCVVVLTGKKKKNKAPPKSWELCFIWQTCWGLQPRRQPLR